jgi:hypothetical protein
MTIPVSSLRHADHVLSVLAFTIVSSLRCRWCE